MRICLVFDCLYPHTVGGAERWYRNLAESLAHRGHTVTYLTLLQWDRATGAGVPNMDVVAVAGRAELYAHARRLEQIGYRGQITLLEGLLPPGKEAAERMPAELTVVFAGRLIPEKQATALVPAVALARQRVPELRATIFGDGPERDALLRLIDESGLDGAVQAPGFVAGELVEDAVRRALCFVFPSRREGYGQVVVEAASVGTPTVVVDAPDNAAVELVEDGVNGFVARSAEPKELGEAILRVHAAGPALRESTADWFRRNRERLSLETSVERVLAVYGRR